MLFRLPLIFSLLLCGPLVAKTVRYEVRDPAQRDLIQVTSDIPLEKMVAVSSAVGGWFEIDPEKLMDNARGELLSDVRTFDSQNSSRNDFLKDRVWQAQEGPTLSFTINKMLHVSKARLSEGQPVAFRLEGLLKYRGQSKVTSVLGKLTAIKQTEGTIAHRGPGNLLRVSANFDLDLTQFGFTTAEIVKARLARYLQVSVDFVASDSPWTPVAGPVNPNAQTSK